MRERKAILTCMQHVIGIVLCVLILTFTWSITARAEDMLRIRVSMAGYKSVLLEWESVRAEDVFQIQRREADSNAYATIATLSGQTGSIKCYDNNVKLGKRYTYRILRVSGDGAVLESNEVIRKITLETPAKVKAKTVKNSRIQVTWNKVNKATSYTVYKSKKANKGFKKVGTVKENRYIDYEVEKGLSYFYKIVANYKRKTDYTSAKSGVACGHLKPGAPTVIGTYTKKKVRITWKKVKGAERYYVYKKNKKGKFEKVKETKKLYYNDSAVSKGKTYTYKVVAIGKLDGKLVKGETGKPCVVLASDIDPKKKMIALTYDDGPSIYTADIVKCLKDNNAKATFFVLGCNIDAHKQALVTVDQMGCEIGNHTYSHLMLSGCSNEQIRTEIASTDKKIKSITGSNATLMRPPGGDVNDCVAQVVEKPVILWSIDTRDWEHRNSNRVIQSVVDNVRDGDIILMHDIYASTRDASLVLIPQLRRMGYQLVTVSELAYYRDVTVKKGQIYRSFRRK